MKEQPFADLASRHLEELHNRGFTLIEDFLSTAQLIAINRLYDGLLGSHGGRNNFEGQHTERIYALVARHKIFQDIVEDPRIIDYAEAR